MGSTGGGFCRQSVVLSESSSGRGLWRAAAEGLRPWSGGGGGGGGAMTLKVTSSLIEIA